VNIYIHRESGAIAGYDFAIDNNDLITLMEDEYWIDTEMEAQIAAEVKIAEKGFDEILTVLKDPLPRSSDGESILGNMIVDAMRDAVNADISFSNFGGIRADLQAGPITPRDLFTVLPYGNKVTVFQVNGQFILDLMEQRVRGNSRGMLLSGARVSVDKNKANGQRVTIHSLAGAAFEKEKIYRLAVSDYLAEGNSGYGMLTEVNAAHIQYTGIVIRQALIDYIVSGKSDKTAVDGRWVMKK
ncbi:5'-nucleotidase C-terminal domain-containing protein, partial [bacterium]|nr:5'-nucleotidase C-terminal domain-containing protein [bacterium]